MVTGWDLDGERTRAWWLERDHRGAGIGYARLRQDWERGTATPVDWDGE